jgi:NTP pyrophosphatase (non-canonical NTP hydrolase)
MKKQLEDIIDFGKAIPLSKWSVQDAVSKLFEEGGELSEAAMIKCGRLPHKKPTEGGDFEETADVILWALDVLLRLNPEMPTKVILNKLSKTLKHKTDKWKMVREKAK